MKGISELLALWSQKSTVPGYIQRYHLILTQMIYLVRSSYHVAKQTTQIQTFKNTTSPLSPFLLSFIMSHASPNCLLENPLLFYFQVSLRISSVRAGLYYATITTFMSNFAKFCQNHGSNRLYSKL